MRLLIGIATYKRIEKLKRLVHSLKNQTYQDFVIHIVCDNNDIETADYIASLEDHRIKYWINDSHEFVIGAWNGTVKLYSTCDWDGFIGLCDDVELKPNALEEIVKCHKKNFPDTDGVVGFNQKCPGHSSYTFKWFGQTLMGRKFIERYKEVDYQICCPDYFHFYQDEEMWDFANSLNRFVNCYEAILDHDHPAFTGSIDETHNVIRQGHSSPKNHDQSMNYKRRNRHFCWGKDFNLIGKGRNYE